MNNNNNNNTFPESLEEQYFQELHSPLKAIGQEIIFENSQIRVWSICLLPSERFPFHIHNINYSWTCLTEGKGLSRHKNKKVVKRDYKKGDIHYYNHDEKGDKVHDLENIGETVLKFIATEYLSQ